MSDFIYGTHPKTWKDVKICTYAMCKNELQFVEKWLNNIWNNGNGSDYICVLDTGSTDGTYEKFIELSEKLNIPKDKFNIQQQTFTPWRFDTSRNYGMQFLPDATKIDVCYCIDLDEIVIDDFWNDLRKIVFEHPNFYRIEYKYAWKIDETSEDQKYVFWYDKIHGVKGWRWEFPVHETLTCDCESIYSGVYKLDPSKVYLKHFADETKSRSNYLPLLELRTKENPNDLYGQYYLAREYGFHDDYRNAIFWDLSLFTRIVSNKSGKEESELLQDISMLPCIVTHLAHSFEKVGLSDEAEFFYNKSLSINNTYRDTYIKYAQFMAYSGNPKKCYEIIDLMNKNSIEIDDWREPKYLWSIWKLNQIIADAKCWEGKYYEAYDLFEDALRHMDDSDKQSAVFEGFFNDLNFVIDKVNKK